MTMIPQTDKISTSCIALHASCSKNVSVTASQFISIYYNYWMLGASSLKSITTLTKQTSSNLNTV